MDRPEWIRALVRDWRAAELTAAQRAMLAYAEKLTRAPWTVAEAGFVGLRAAEFSDAAIRDICQVTACSNLVNRMANGLGVELELGREREPFDPTDALGG